MKKINAIDLYIILNYISLVFWLLLGTSILILIILIGYEPPYSSLHEFITEFCIKACLIILIYTLITFLQILSIKFAINLKTNYSKNKKFLSFLILVIANLIYFIPYGHITIAAILLLAPSLPLLYNIHE